MSTMQRLLEQASDLLATPSPTQTAAVKTTWFDRRDWETTQEIPVVGQVVEAMDQELRWAADLAADVHGALYRVDPRLHTSEEMAPSHRANRDIVAQLLTMREVCDLRQNSVADSYGTAMAMVALQEAVTGAAKSIYAEYETAEQAREQARERAAELTQALADPDAPESLVEDLAQALADAQAPDPDGATMAAQFAGPLRKAARQADEQLSKDAALAAAYGAEPGDLQRMDASERVRLAQRLRGSRLARFADLIGAFKAVQRGESRKRIVDAASEVHGVTTGSDLTRMVAGEYLNFADPSLQTLMLARWAEGQLVQNDVRGKDKVGQGPIVAVVDESGSMSNPLGGATREAWSKALALALLDQARKRDRDFVYIGFASASSQRLLRFPKGRGGIEAVLELTENFLGGGTHYERPLQMALAEATAAGAEAGRPDIVLISDEEYGPMEQDFMSTWLKTKDKLDLRCYGISVGVGAGPAMTQVADNVRSISELTADPREVGDLFRTI